MFLLAANIKHLLPIINSHVMFIHDNLESVNTLPERTVRCSDDGVAAEDSSSTEGDVLTNGDESNLPRVFVIICLRSSYNLVLPVSSPTATV